MRVTADLLEYAVKGHPEAYRFLSALYDVALVWDDLIDKDKQVLPHDINAAFTACLIKIPRNPFYMQNFLHLNAVLESVIRAWGAANELRGHPELAYVLASDFAQLILACAAITGGPAWADSIAPEVYRRLHSETLEEYAARHAGEV